ncbi:hypothetical protein METSCH_E02280 [Metschnikowia aff. pulcherrima]|uniref:Uncharacterized protein n=1 Tax=Metschnikowia aff. pulcherrima TaxID=2163413 RepID=A0A4P6XVA1_9ASCO|nr:hypothetical protein METSCH_E02280 [Metschnikowia aff. pulcherrima]
MQLFDGSTTYLGDTTSEENHSDEEYKKGEASEYSCRKFTGSKPPPFSKLKNSHNPFMMSDSLKSQTIIPALALIFMSIHAAAAMPREQPHLFLRFEDMTCAIEAFTDMVMQDPHVTSFYFLVGHKLVGVTDFTLHYPNVATAGQNLSLQPSSIVWNEHHVIQQGTWWDKWRPASCVHQNGLGDTPVTVTVTQGMAASAKYKAGFHLEYGKMAALHFGHETTGKNENSGVRTYVVPAHSFGQVWQQQLMVWQDQQVRRCVKLLGNNVITYGKWSESLRGDLPVTDGASYGWSTGWENMDFGSCSGGT